jgi:hypothetical protein
MKGLLLLDCTTRYSINNKESLIGAFLAIRSTRPAVFPEFEIYSYSQMNRFKYLGSLRAACNLTCRHLHHNQPEWELLELESSKNKQRGTDQRRQRVIVYDS